MMWGGRFNQNIDDTVFEFTSSINYDYRLIYEDIELNIAHTQMLSKINIITDEEADIIIKGLKIIKEEFKNDGFTHYMKKSEDIHSYIEKRLTEIIGVVAGKMHTGKSRNDQVATALKLYLNKRLMEIKEKINILIKTLLTISEDNLETIMPGYTHLQRAQPISLAFHFLSYVSMFVRDKERLNNIFTQLEVNPLGAGALAGSTLPLELNLTSEILGFKSTYKIALDAVSNRDYVLDSLHFASVLQMHLSRMAEELILWSSTEWNFIKIGDSFTTGSSLMPQKKNPDVLELIRGKTGRVYGNYISVATMMKGLPLSYNRDMQEDKESLFDSLDTIEKSLTMMAATLNNITINKERFYFELEGTNIYATELAEYLVLKNVAFRDAHKIIGQIVLDCENNNIKLNQLTLEDYKNYNYNFEKDIYEIFEPKNSLKRKKTINSPNMIFMKEVISNYNKY